MRSRFLNQGGFTLLELIVAMLVFALLSVTAFGGLRSIIDSRHTLDRRIDELSGLQFAVGRLEQDLSQIITDGVRHGETEQLPPLSWDGSRLRLVRSGRSNPQGLPRSNLVVVSYEVQGSTLYRASWSPSIGQWGEGGKGGKLLEEIDGISVRFLDRNRAWSTYWERGETSLLSPSPRLKLPLAVEVTLQLSRAGEIKRLIPLPGAG